MIQVYVPVRDRKRITLPAAVCKVMGLDDGHWVRVSVLDGESALLQRVPEEVPPSHLIRGATALRSASVAAAKSVPHDQGGASMTSNATHRVG